MQVDFFILFIELLHVAQKLLVENIKILFLVQEIEAQV